MRLQYKIATTNTTPKPKRKPLPENVIGYGSRRYDNLAKLLLTIWFLDALFYTVFIKIYFIYGIYGILYLHPLVSQRNIQSRKPLFCPLVFASLKSYILLIG